MSAEDHPAMELTRNPVDGSHGFVCREHGILRTGLTHQHAVNVENKHRREDHSDPLALGVDLTAAARMFLACQETSTRDLWAALVGLDDQEDAYRLAKKLAEAPQHVVAAVVPF